MMTWFDQINKNWTLFLDRDGVINYESETDYIRNWESFRFLPGVIDAFPIFKQFFSRIFIVSNQKGVGKGLMTENDLISINENLVKTIDTAGGHIDRVYYCTSLDDADPFRKPNNGMALKAREEFPEISFSSSLMVGNTMSDMEFGKSLGMRTIFIPSAKPKPILPDPRIDQVFNDLATIAKALQKSVVTK